MTQELGVTRNFGGAFRHYALLTVVIAGAAILVIEILGVRMLAPYFGSSHFVWTAQISVTLAALCCGYYLGGRLARNPPNPSLAFWCLLIAGLWLSLALLVFQRVAYRCFQLDLAAGALCASAVLFFVPLAMLAAVGPFFVRLIALSLETVGTLVGRVSALSTAGSVGGVVLIGYFLIPHAQGSLILFWVGVSLFALAALYFLIWVKRLKDIFVVALGVLVGTAAGVKGLRTEQRLDVPNVIELERRNSHFGLLQVLEIAGTQRRIFLNDWLTQNIYDAATKQSLAMFSYALHGLARMYTREIKSALVIGLGVGLVPMQLAREGVEVDVVEINETVVPMAEKYFDLEPRLLEITIGDGRFFLNRCTNIYDCVVIDAFLGDSSPSHLLSREAFSEVRNVLRPGGTLLLNTVGRPLGEGEFLIGSIQRTLRAVFPFVRVHVSPTGSVFFVASDREPAPMGDAPSLEGAPPIIRRQVERCYARVLTAPPKRGVEVTDDYNPLEFYDAENREQLRRNLVIHAGQF